MVVVLLLECGKQHARICSSDHTSGTLAHTHTTRTFVKSYEPPFKLVTNPNTK